MKRRLVVSTILSVLFLLLVNAAAFHVWVFSGAPVSAGDWHFNDEISLKDFFGPPDIINNSGFTGIDIMGLSFYPFNFLTALLSHYGFSYSQALRAIFLYPIVFIGPISFYFLILKVFKSRLAAVLGALLYQFNPYFMILSNGVLTLRTAYSFAPLAILVYLQGLEKKSYKYYLLDGVILYIASFYEVRGVYLIMPILIGLSLYHIFLVQPRASLKSVVASLALSTIPFFVVLLQSFYWIFGLLANHNPEVGQVLFHRALFGEGIMSAIASINEFHPFWAGDHSTNFVIMQVLPYFWFLPLAALLGFWLNRRHKLVVFFALLSFFGVLMSKQSAEPFGSLYKWLFFNVPGFSAFRESSKFYFYIAVGYSFLIASLISRLSQLKRFPKWVLGGIALMLFYIVAQNAKGEFTGAISGLSVPRQVPAEYLALKSYLSSQPEFFRALWLPYYSRWVPNYQQHPKLAANALYYSGWNVVNPDQPVTVKATEAERFVEMLSSPKSQRLLNMSSIKYVVIPLQDNANDDEFFYLFNKPRDYYLSSIKNINYLVPESFQTSPSSVQLYKNPQARPLFYLTSLPESVDVDVPYRPVSYKRIASYEYEIQLGSFSEPVLLQFATAFDPNWQAILPGIKWPGVFFAQPLSGFHASQRNIAGLNSFIIDPSLSGKTIQLYYQPEAYVLLGWYLSLFFGTVVILLLILPHRKPIK